MPSLNISVPHGHLEALLEEPSGESKGKALLCHPHSKQGGTMHTKGLYHAAKALRNVGFTTLRFNFRGVGTSTGAFDGGEGESEDTRHALRTLKDHGAELPIVLLGFSFGASVGLRVGSNSSFVDCLIGMGIALELDSFEFLNTVDRPTLLLQGENDRFGRGDRLQEKFGEQNPSVTIRIVKNSDHLFTGRFDSLRQYIKEYFINGPGESIFD